VGKTLIINPKGANSGAALYAAFFLTVTLRQQLTKNKPQSQMKLLTQSTNQDN
jgi:hypothetical protein